MANNYIFIDVDKVSTKNSATTPFSNPYLNPVKSPIAMTTLNWPN